MTTLILMLIYGRDRHFPATVAGAALGILVKVVLGLIFIDSFQIHSAVMESRKSLLYTKIVHTNIDSFGLVTFYPQTVFTSGLLLMHGTFNFNILKFNKNEFEKIFNGT